MTTKAKHTTLKTATLEAVMRRAEAAEEDLYACEKLSTELLDGAKNLLAWLREFYPDEPLFSRESRIANITVTAMEAAIAKAEEAQ